LSQSDSKWIRGLSFFFKKTQFEVQVFSDKPDKIKYSYHYMNQEQHLVFRYDNAPHHHELSTFPHHKHLPSKVEPHKELTLRDVLLEIAQDKNLNRLKNVLGIEQK
jgi:hypothetical protein